MFRFGKNGLGWVFTGLLENCGCTKECVWFNGGLIRLVGKFVVFNLLKLETLFFFKFWTVNVELSWCKQHYEETRIKEPRISTKRWFN